MTTGEQDPKVIWTPKLSHLLSQKVNSFILLVRKGLFSQFLELSFLFHMFESILKFSWKNVPLNSRPVFLCAVIMYIILNTCGGSTKFAVVGFSLEPNDDVKLLPVMVPSVLFKDPCLTNTCVSIFNRNFPSILEVLAWPKAEDKGYQILPFLPEFYCSTLPSLGFISHFLHPQVHVRSSLRRRGETETLKGRSVCSRRPVTLLLMGEAGGWFPSSPGSWWMMVLRKLIKTESPYRSFLYCHFSGAWTEPREHDTCL